MKVGIYLRKSRADEETEKRLGEGETLQKHRNILLRFAKENNLDIVKIREEIVSGESIIHRPEMLELLKEIEHKLYDAVLVMDIDRLGRGGMQEQGLILETFKKSNTKIITPRKTYDLQNDFDEEYSEFEAFMSRKELKIINRRLQRGRIQSVEEGNYIGTLPPYGYIKDGKGSLIPHPEQSEVVKLIFDMYTSQDIGGGGAVAKELNKLGYKTYTGKRWTLHAVINIIENPVYTGKICWNKKQSQKGITQLKRRTVEKRPVEEWVVAEGRHVALVSREMHEKANQIKKTRIYAPVNFKRPLANPLAGLVICAVCGENMRRRPYAKFGKKDMLTCENAVGCQNKGNAFEDVENRIISHLQDWLVTWESEKGRVIEKENKASIYRKSIEKLKTELTSLGAQKLQLHDLLEQQVYDVKTFLDRSKNLADRSESIEENIKLLEEKIISESKTLNIESQINFFRHALGLYNTLSNATEKNILLKTLLDRVEYKKEKHQKAHNFDLKIFPKVLQY